MKGQNRGFSLVELIIVIAIMAILVGVMAPQLIKYIEKTNVSADIQLCDSVREAIILAANDPDVITANDLSSQMIQNVYNPDPTGSTKVSRLDHSYGDAWLNCAFSKEVEDNLGFNPFASDSHQYMKSYAARTNGGLMTAVNEDGTDFRIFIQNSDRTAKKNSYQYFDGMEGLADSDVIFAE